MRKRKTFCEVRCLYWLPLDLINNVDNVECAIASLYIIKYFELQFDISMFVFIDRITATKKRLLLFSNTNKVVFCIVLQTFIQMNKSQQHNDQNFVHVQNCHATGNKRFPFVQEEVLSCATICSLLQCKQHVLFKVCIEIEREDINYTYKADITIRRCIV